MKSHLHPSCLLAASLALVLAVAARGAEENANTIRFSDPSKPGTVKINLGRGELRVHGSDTTEVAVKSEAKAVTSKPRKDGMRVISASSSFSLKESDNVVVLDAAGHDLGRGSGDFRLTVPRNTTVVVQNAWGGNISCSGLSGDIEINSMHGEIRLDDVAGGVVVGTMNGEIRATIRELREGKPLSFTSMNGEVSLRLPPEAKASVRLRTQNGSVLTDFDETALVTKAENSPSHPRGRTLTFKGSKVITNEVQEAIREAALIGASAIREALEAVKEGLEAARLDSDDARRELDTARRDLEKAHRDAERERTRAERAGRTGESTAAGPVPPAPVTPPTPATAPLPPRLPMPTISGGKLVTGTLNGGGPEISISTMNGDITLRKADVKK